MGEIHYWNDYINKKKLGNIRENDCILKFNIKNNISNEIISKYFFFTNKLQLIRFVKYVILPSFIYIKIGINSYDEVIIKAQDYKEILNFFVSNNIPSSKELIRKYSFFYNSLEEFEYQSLNILENNFDELRIKFNNYFKDDTDSSCEIKYYCGLKNLIDSIFLEDENEHIYKELKNIFFMEREFLREFLKNNINNEILMNKVESILNKDCLLGEKLIN